MPSPRQPAYDAVFDIIRTSPARAADPYGGAAENARVWRAVEAALDAMGCPAGEPPSGLQMASEQARVGANSGRPDTPGSGRTASKQSVAGRRAASNAPTTSSW